MSGVVVNRCDFSVGQSIGGGYRVDQVLGEGSFGKVFRVTGRDASVYALKLLKLWEIVPELRKPLMARFVMEFETGRIQSRFGGAWRGKRKSLHCNGILPQGKFGAVYGTPFGRFGKSRSGDSVRIA